MRELCDKATSVACELAALLMVVDEGDMDNSARENLISLSRRVADELAVIMLDQWREVAEK